MISISIISVTLCLLLMRLGNLPVERAKDAVCFLQQGGVSVASSAIMHNIVKVKVSH